MNDDVFGWMAIGAAASLAAMIWPFHRGTAGVVANLATGSVGAIAFGLTSSLFWPAAREGPVRLPFAALGAIVALLVTHSLWHWRVRQRRRSIAAPVASPR
jgi:uncharacterized membrane protein YeaQ/YmgE (transglycosylase-associated protein family)